MQGDQISWSHPATVPRRLNGEVVKIGFHKVRSATLSPRWGSEACGAATQYTAGVNMPRMSPNENKIPPALLDPTLSNDQYNNDTGYLSQ